MKKYEYWKDIPGYDGKYQASVMGEIRRVYKKSNKTKILSIYRKNSLRNNTCKGVIHLNRKEVIASRAIWETFNGKIPKDMRIFHKNNDVTDNRLPNLEMVTMREVGLRSGYKSRRKSVAKIDHNGEAVEWYYSAREAGRRNFMSAQTICDYCNGAHKKSKIALDGYVYMWGDDLE